MPSCADTATALPPPEALDDEGWLHTGDLGILDDDGYLRLIIKTAGHNVSPSAIEATLLAETPADRPGLLLGDGRPSNVALMTVAPTVACNGGTRAVVAEAVVRANARLSVPERIADFVLLEDTWIPGTDELTPTRKVRRPAVAARYQELIDAMYTDGRRSQPIVI